MLTARRPGMYRANAHAKRAQGSKLLRSYSPLACHPKGERKTTGGLKDAGATPLPNGTLVNTTLLPLLPDRQANASYPQRERRETCSPRPLDGTAEIFAAPCLILNQRVFLEFLARFSLPPLGGPREAVKQHLNRSSVTMHHNCECKYPYVNTVLCNASPVAVVCPPACRLIYTVK